MKRRPLAGALALALTLVPGAALADRTPPAALPANPGQLPAARSGVGVKAPSVQERAQRGVVIIERGGQVLGLGAALSGDGRVLTALSPLGPGNDLDVRFADGSTAKVKIGHHDRTWDLALLVPQTGRWTDGMVASSREPVRPDANIHGFTANHGKTQLTSVILRSHRTLIGADDRQIDNAIELGSRVNPADLGTPLIDEDGKVVGLLGRGCAPNDGRPCTPVAFGIPMNAIRAFLRTVPASAVPPSAWLGIQGVAENTAYARGVRVLVVHPDSPADQAHLRGGDRSTSDVILAVDGAPVTTPEALAEVIHHHGIGEKVPITVYSDGKYKTVAVTLRAAPDARSPGAPPANPAELPDAPIVRPKR